MLSKYTVRLMVYVKLKQLFFVTKIDLHKIQIFTNKSSSFFLTKVFKKYLVIFTEIIDFNFAQINIFN